MMTFTTSCVSAHGDDINNMKDAAQDITRQTFIRYVNPLTLLTIALQLGYAKHHKQGLTMAGDFHITYHKSIYKNQPCVYFTWAAIEYIFQ